MHYAFEAGDFFQRILGTVVLRIVVDDRITIFPKTKNQDTPNIVEVLLFFKEGPQRPPFNFSIPPLKSRQCPEISGRIAALVYGETTVLPRSLRAVHRSLLTQKAIRLKNSSRPGC